MNSLWNALLPLAYRDSRLDGIASGFRQRQSEAHSTSMLVLLAVFGGIIIAFWVMVRWADRRERQEARSHPWRLFYQLGKAHRLSWREMWVLWRLARQQGLADPARIFLEPERLTATSAEGLANWQREVLESLPRRLFAELYDRRVPDSSDETGSASTPETAVSALEQAPVNLALPIEAVGDAPSATV